MVDSATIGLYCAVGDSNCGNFNGVGYFTSGGGQCGGDPVFISAPQAAGLNYSKYWCGSYYIGAANAAWGNDPGLLKPV